MPHLLMKDIATNKESFLSWPAQNGLPAANSYIWYAEKAWRVCAVWHNADDRNIVGLVTVIEDTVVESPFKRVRTPVRASGG